MIPKSAVSMSSMTLVTNSASSSHLRALRWGLPIAIMIGLFVGGCSSQQEAIQNQHMAGSMLSNFPDLGPVQTPQTLPYPENSALRAAYLDGFSAGWMVVQNVGNGALTSPPLEFCDTLERQKVWNIGLHAGKHAAFHVFEQKQHEAQIGEQK